MEVYRSDEHYYVKSKFVPGKKNTVYAKDDNGTPTGEYTGYWNPKTDTVTLYPAKGSWIYGRLVKHKISVRLIKLI